MEHCAECGVLLLLLLLPLMLLPLLLPAGQARKAH
jgi:hypothetical protein